MDKRVNFFITESESCDSGMVVNVHGYASTVSADLFFRDVSRIICFSDCAPQNVIDIVWHGQHVSYDGWRRQMCYGYSTKSGKQVWVGCFPEWDH